MSDCENCNVRGDMCANCACDFGHYCYTCDICLNYMELKGRAPLVSPKCIQNILMKIGVLPQITHHEPILKKHRTES